MNLIMLFNRLSLPEPIFGSCQLPAVRHKGKSMHFHGNDASNTSLGVNMSMESTIILICVKKY